MTIELEQKKTNIGKRALYQVPLKAFKVPVMITAVRYVYGRFEYQIKADGGEGSPWVEQSAVILAE